MEYRTREQWGASYDVSGRVMMATPAPDLWIHHTVTEPTDDPDSDMRGIERIDINRFGIPSYSWVIHPSGVVLEGMGLHIGAHTLGHNSTSFGVAFIGDFRYDEPTDAALLACRELINILHLFQSLVMGDQPTGGHRDVVATVCPGDNLYARIPDLRVPIGGQPTPPPPPSPPPTPPPPPDSGVCDVQVRVLRRNDQQSQPDGQVRAAQAILREKAGQNIATDGFFGRGTEQAVINWQRWFNLGVDGVIGEQTWTSLLGA